MITKNYGQYIVVCDCCGEQVGDGYDTFQDAVDGRRADPDIRTHKTPDGWQDTCHECEGRMRG